jgi:hypothetical protein
VVLVAHAASVIAAAAINHDFIGSASFEACRVRQARSNFTALAGWRKGLRGVYP